MTSPLHQSPADGDKPRPTLDWSRFDIEQRLLFPGGRYTRVNNLLTGLLGVIGTLAFYGILQIPGIRETHFAEVFNQRGPTQHAVVLLFFWSLAILAIKSSKLRFQWRSLDVRVIPNEPGFVLSTATVGRVLDHIHDCVDDPRHFVLFNRIVVALANFRNLGHVGDVDDILRSQAAQDESAMETSYALIQGFVWAIPVLGFIGTVLGLSGAIGQFSGVLGDAGDIGAITTALKGVTGGLATAFDTTLVALVAALILQLLMTVLKKQEEEFLDAAMEFGIRNVVGRLRLMANS
ncbi:MAG: MotA/TolQ/ExbB proton channel family protein [Planctomycetota bacterium]